MSVTPTKHLAHKQLSECFYVRFVWSTLRARIASCFLPSSTLTYWRVSLGSSLLIAPCTTHAQPLDHFMYAREFAHHPSDCVCRFMHYCHFHPGAISQRSSI